MNIWKRYSMRVSKNWVKFNKMFTLSPCQQGNLAAIAISGPAVIQFGQLNQSTTNLNGSQSVAILGAALSQNRGLVGINQGAGEGNQQLNAFALSLDDSGLGVVTVINLSSSVA